jgi:hypothetical protein
VERDRLGEPVRVGLAGGGQLLEGGQVGARLGAGLPEQRVADRRDREGWSVAERPAQPAERGAEAVAPLGLAVLLPEQGRELAAADRAPRLRGQVIKEGGRLAGREQQLLAAQMDAW